MPKITVTGATGKFGNLVIDNLLKLGVPPGELRASVRDVAKAAHHRERGIDVRHGDFDDPEALKSAFADAGRLLIISTDQVGSRVEQHRRAVQAAQAAGVQRILYTSGVSMGPGGEASNPITLDHRATEKIIRETGLPYTILRNTYYAEYMLAGVVQALDQGAFVSSSGDGKLAAASYTDLAEAAAAALLEEGRDQKIYELTFPRAWDYYEAVEIARQLSGRPLVYTPVSEEEMAAILRQAGVPEQAVQMALGFGRTIREGDLAKVSPDLERLLGRPATPLTELVRRMLR